jgi:(p)ppGpp synthase/HD superfamily hydrolase
MSASNWPVLHLRVSAQPDPGALARILERFQNLNVTPRRVRAEWGTTDVLYVEVQIAGLSAETMDLITAKVSQVPSILTAYWHR